jgi:FAD/FMN-containing dehydrogenase
MQVRQGVQVTNWEGSIPYDPAVVADPQLVEDLVAIMRDPAGFPAPVRAVGSTHTTTHCGVATGGTVVRMTGMNRILEVGADWVRAEAGALYIDVAQELRRRGLQFYVNIELGNLTMGAAACTGTKDASMPGEFGQVASYCTALKLVTPAGQLVEITEQDPERLCAARSSYGLFGIIYEVTFRVRPLHAMATDHRSYTTEAFLRELPALRRRGESMMLYLFPFLDRVGVEFRRYDPTRKPETSLLWRFRNWSWKSAAPGFGYLCNRFVPWRPLRHALIDTFYRTLLIVLDVLMKDRNTCATDQQIRYPEKSDWTRYTFSIWAFPEDRYPEILRGYFQFCRDWARDHGYRCNLLNVGYRIAQDRNPLLSYTWESDVLTVDPVTTPGPGWDEFLHAYNAWCSEHGGSPLFNQTKWVTPAQARRAFGERLDRLEALRREYDPGDRLLNDYFAGILRQPVSAESAS